MYTNKNKFNGNIYTYFRIFWVVRNNWAWINETRETTDPKYFKEINSWKVENFIVSWNIPKIIIRQKIDKFWDGRLTRLIYLIPIISNNLKNCKIGVNLNITISNGTKNQRRGIDNVTMRV